jgi:hypothetical protein
MGQSVDSRRGRKTACSTVFGQKDGSASASALKKELKIGGLRVAGKKEAD